MLATDTATAHPRALASTPTQPVHTGTSPAILAALKEPETELAIWQRTLPPELAQWLGTVSPPATHGVRGIAHPSELGPALADWIATWRPGNAVAGAALIADIVQLATLFTDVIGTKQVDYRLEWIAGDSCWKFHRDCVSARLLTTYRGPGTQWVTPDLSDGALRAQRAFDGRIRALGTGDVSVFTGSCAGDGRGIVHRSPPISGSGDVRLLLCLNPPHGGDHEVQPGVA
ncbi:MAG: DUF1826 domain-containing protein [Alphaproteobacteria bacterium]|nr:DUF1826 domain-containing protein [Alphaproteobacteria bacterium]